MSSCAALIVCALCASSLSPVAQPAERIPLILVPGFMGQRPAGVMGPYFHGWRAALEDAGAEVYEVAPPPVATSEQRGLALVRAIDGVLAETGAARVVVITHSQGGLDVRVALGELERAGRGDVVGAVATIAAPHAGTGVADSALAWPRPLVSAALASSSALWQVMQREPVMAVEASAALESLATPGAAAFSRRHLAPRTPLFSVAGYSGADVDDACTGGRWTRPSTVDAPHPALVFGRAMMRAALGEVTNDGVVPTRSMRFGTFLGCVAADHVDWQGWDARVDLTPFVVALWRALDDVALSHDAAAIDRHVARLALLARSRPRA